MSSYLNGQIALKELYRIAHGERSTVPLPVLATFLGRCCVVGSVLGCTPEAPCPKHKDDSLKFLRDLYALEDPRHA